MSNKPNVTVIYQEAPAQTPGLVAVLVELLAFLVFLGLAAVLGSCGMFR